MRWASPPERVPAARFEREVVEADVDQEPQPLVDLLQHPLGDLLVAGVELQLAQEVRAVADRHRGDLGDRLLHDRDREDDRLQPCALAGGAGHLAHVALEALTAGVALGLAVPPLHEGDGAFEGRRVHALAPVPVAVADLDLRLVAVQQGLPRALRQSGEGDVGPESQRVREGADQAAEVVLGVAVRPGVDGALVEGLVLVRDDQLGVDLHARTDAGALGAGAEGRVEGEGAGLQLLEGQVVVRAVQVLRVHALALGVVLGEVDEVEHDHAAGEAEGGLHGVGEAALGAVLHREAVDDHLDGVLLLLLQRGRLGELDRSRRPPAPGCSPWSGDRRRGRRTRPCARAPAARAPGSGCPRAAPAPCRRWPAATGGRWGGRTRGSAACRCARRAAAGSRRPR